MGPVSLKMYDKHGFILRIETTVNDVSFFKNHRQVEHRDGTTQTKWTSMKKGIYSLPALREGAVRRQSPLFGVHLGIDTPTARIDALTESLPYPTYTRRRTSSLSNSEYRLPWRSTAHFLAGIPAFII